MTTPAEFIAERLRALLTRYDVAVTTYSPAAWALLDLTGDERRSGWADLRPSPVLSPEGLNTYELKVCPITLVADGVPCGEPTDVGGRIVLGTLDGRARLISHVVMHQWLGLEEGGDPATVFALLSLADFGDILTPAHVLR